MSTGKYDRKGKPLDLMTWANLMEDHAYRRVAETTLSNGTWISTVWLGLDHNFGHGAPLIFETMVFPARDDKREEDSDRYSTEAEALDGHAAMVAKYTAQVTSSV